MIDLLHLPEPDERTVWFLGQDAGWRVWTKPRGISMVYIYMIGGGGGGGGGAGNNAGATAGGGAGGLQGALTRCLYPSFTLPDRLYVSVPAGGIGGAGGTLAAGNPGTAPPHTYVAVYPNTTAGNLVGIAWAGVGGGAGTLTSGGSGGSAGFGPAVTDAPLCQMAAAFNFPALNRDQNGLSGTTGAGTGESQIEKPILRGCSGGGKTTGSGGAGGGYSGYNNAGVQWPAVPGGSAETGADASSGFILRGYAYGGCGGGGSNTTVGGRGGNGVSWGSGGGGGGGGLTTGGRGGDGGPGLVIISSW